MRSILTVIAIACTCFRASGQFLGLVVNEFSQGNSGSREYIELLVAGNRTCTDSTANISGWIVDDQNGWYGNTNSTQGHYRFKQDPVWASVSFGSIILLYNAADKNPSIHLADDPTDADRDGVYVVPVASPYIEQFTSAPNNTSGAAYKYPDAATTTGYVPSTNQWPFILALNNTNGDVISVVSPGNRSAAFFSIAYGYAIGAGYQNPVVNLPNVGPGTSAFLSSAHYTTANDWVVAAVPSAETPGGPNGGANTIWIQQMRTQRPVIARENKVVEGCDSVVYNSICYYQSTEWIDTLKSSITQCDSVYRTIRILVRPSPAPVHLQVCKDPSQTYTFNGQVLTTGGVYAATFRSATGCDSVVHLLLTVVQAKDTTVTGCKTVLYNGVAYTASTSFTRIIPSLLTGCDSVRLAVHIRVLPSPLLSINQVPGICKGDSVQLRAKAAGIITWQGLGMGDSITVHPVTTTTYTAIAVSNFGCRDTASVLVNVSEFHVQLTAAPNPFFSGGTVQVNAFSASAFRVINWQPSYLFGNTQTTSVVVTADSSLRILVKAKDGNGCTDTASLLLLPDPMQNIYLPSVFTPNGDGRNDIFKAFGGQFLFYDLKVFNRNGQLVFATTDRAKGWNGTTNGEPQPPQVYVYLLQGTLKNGTPVRKKGTVMLVR